MPTVQLEEPEADLERRRIRLREPSIIGVALALVFWWYSLLPTLIPRSATTQLAVSCVCLALGYGVGALIGFLMRWAVRKSRIAVRPWIWIIAWIIVSIAWLSLAVSGGVKWIEWQNGQNRVMGMTSVGAADALIAVVGSILLGILLILLARVLRRGTGALRRVFDRLLPARFARAPIFVVVFVLGLGLVAALVFQGATSMIRSTHAANNDNSSLGLVAPTSTAVSGGPGSLVAWDELGRMGRDFTGGVSSQEDLRAFAGDADVKEPVRAYVGLQSAPTIEERSALAVQELERAGGFDRKVLAVWIPTGTGWVIKEAAASLEHMYQGDTAIVAMQYSYLPSLFGVLLEPGLAVDAGTQLINAVVARWEQLPENQRPKLLLFSKSLGTGGVEAPFAAVDSVSSVANMTARVDGALIVGAMYKNPILRQVTAARDPESPVWQPVYDDGRSVRFVTRDPRQPDLAEMTGGRIIYLVHPSDPVTFWGIDALWKAPEWFDQPRGFDVPAAARWFPIVSPVQAIADQIGQLDTPPGFGHVFSTDYVNGWAQVLPPDGWTDADTDRLDEFLRTEDATDAEP